MTVRLWRRASTKSWDRIGSVGGDKVEGVTLWRRSDHALPSSFGEIPKEECIVAGRIALI